jgi:hypothetical protein
MVKIEPGTLEKISDCVPPVVAFALITTVVPLIELIFVPAGIPVP